MNNLGKILALDYGSKKIGVAISDSSRQFCFIRPYIRNTDENQVLEDLAIFCGEENVKEVVVGVPYMADMKKTAQTARNLEFVEKLRSKLDVPVHTFDESYSTFEAKELLEEVKLKGEKEADLKDSFSAYVILQRYLA